MSALKLSPEAKAAVERVAMQVDVSQYNPKNTFYDKHGRWPAIAELAAYTAEIRVLEAIAVLNRIEGLLDNDHDE